MTQDLMIFGATYLIYLTLILVLILAVKGGIKEKKSFLLIILALPVAVILIKFIHLFIYEPRPFVAFHFTPLIPETPDASFPSRHATVSAVIAFTFTYFKSKWALLVLFFMVWVGLSRIYVGVHFPLDIIGGFVVAIIALIISIQVKKILKIGFLR